MEISARTRGNIEIFNIAGRADMHTHEELRQAVRYAIHCGRSSVVLDLRHAAFLDSLSIGELAACLKRTRENGGDIKLVVAPGSSVHHTLQIVGLDRILPIFGDVDEATAAYK